MSVLILKLRTEHRNPNIASSLLCRKVKQSSNLCIYLTALSKVVLIKLGHVDNPSIYPSSCLIMPASLNSVLDSLILGFLHLSPDKFTLRVPGPCFPCISLLEILILSLIISLFLTSLKALENNLASLVTLWHERGRTMQSPLCRSISLRYYSVYGHWWVGRSGWKEANPMVLSPHADFTALSKQSVRAAGGAPCILSQLF